jgi:tetratricopeptide (TPR) repeat protein
VVREEECGLAREFRPTEKEGLQPLPATADLGEGGTESNSQVAPPWRDDLAVLEPPVPAPEASPEVAAARPEAEDLWEAIWLEASINYEVRELHQGGPFVADTNLGMGRAEKWAGTIRFDTATATTNQDHAGVFPRVRSASGRSRRTSTRPSTSRARPRHEIDPPHAAAPTASTTTNPPREAPSAGRQPKEDARRLPTAREILSANHAARTDAATTRPRTRRRVRIEPTPTVCREPAHWTIPLWVGWFPATAAALVVGGVGVALAWGWSIESKNAGMIANRLARGGTKVEPIPAWLTPPEPKWWTTTPGHLALWALDRDRTASDPAAVEEVHELLSAAAQASPLQPLVRFALARSGAEAGDATAGRAPSVALSRDVLSLAWTGHQLLASGKKEAALKAYRAALEMAAQADLTRLAPPAFLDDPQVSRFALPAEDLVGPIVRDMAGRGDWTYAEWSRALPPSSVASLAAARVLRERSSPDAEAALDAILARSDAPTLAGAPAAIHLALKAEALALRAQPNWAEAEKLYRQAIDQLPEGVFRRSWWMNLADLALRLNDESNRQKALESAKGRDQNDEIARRAVELLKDYSVRTERN